ILMSEQQKILADLTATIKHQIHLMEQSLGKRHQLMDALKHAANFLNELRTSLLTPKQYYELYILVYDALESLATHLRSLHPHHHLSDLYELVQYAGNLVPRLYLMLTVGTVYMALDDAPKAEVMRDMLEMCRGVQHPIRGLFLRYYLMQRTKGLIDQADSADAILFIITNFIEMNKLWVRLQHQGHSSQRSLRTLERQQLQILVGSNLVRLSQLEGVDVEVYKEQILPAVMEQIVQCRDVLAQEYLVDVIIQIFPDQWHLATMDYFLDRVLELNEGVGYYKFWVGMVDRLEDLIKNPAEEDLAKDPVKAESSTGSFSSDLFLSLFNHYTQLSLTTSLSPTESSKILSSLCKLCIAMYPANYGFVDQILQTALEIEANAADDEWLALLLTPVVNYTDILTLLHLKNFNALLGQQNEKLQRRIIGEILDKLLATSKTGLSTGISDVGDVLGICEYFKIVVSNNFGPNKVSGVDVTAKALGKAPEVSLLHEKFAKIFHLFHAPNPLDTLKIYKAIDRSLCSVDSAATMPPPQQRAVNASIKLQIYPTLIQQTLSLTRRFRAVPANEATLVDIFKLVGTLLSELLSVSDSNVYPEMCLKLYLSGALIANHLAYKFKLARSDGAVDTLCEISYDFFVQSFLIYEEYISDSRTQYQCLVMIISKLTRLLILTETFKASYETLITKTTLYGSKLLKKTDQCRAVYLASHLWWGTLPEEADETLAVNDGKRVLECLQRSLRVADSVFSTSTSFNAANLVSLELFVEILNQCLYYFIHGNESINVRYINGLVELIQTNLTNLENELEAGSADAEEAATTAFAATTRHFKRTLTYIEGQKEIDERFQMLNTRV
ncbi:hypothetical protein BABINDRAFT_42504, partial [Babjeviella inositovora NRRL Y-12698]